MVIFLKVFSFTLEAFEGYSRCWISLLMSLYHGFPSHVSSNEQQLAGSVQTGTLFSHWVISEVVDLGFQFGFYG